MLLSAVHAAKCFSNMKRPRSSILNAGAGAGAGAGGAGRGAGDDAASTGTYAVRLAGAGALCAGADGAGRSIGPFVTSTGAGAGGDDAASAGTCAVRLAGAGGGALCVTRAGLGGRTCVAVGAEQRRRR